MIKREAVSHKVEYTKTLRKPPPRKKWKAVFDFKDENDRTEKNRKITKI